MFKVKLGRKYITLSPRPIKDIENGLLVVFDRATSSCTKEAMTDIKAGQIRYTLPKDDRKIIKAYVRE